MQAVALQPLAGGDVGSLGMSVNFASYADYAASMQKIQSDAGWQEFFAAASASGAAQQVESSLMNDLDPAFQPGGLSRPMQSIVGAYPMSMMVATTFVDMDAYGAYADAANSDPEWQAFWAGAMSDPTADLLRTGLYVNMTD